jgi:hypothetical protein
MPWLKLLGLVLVGAAVSVAFDPDYPVSRSNVTQLKGQARITPQNPRGPTQADEEFRWQADFESPEWRLVLLSSNRSELAWSAPQGGRSYRPEGDFRIALERRGRFYWYVVGSKGGSQVRSAITAILVR